MRTNLKRKLRLKLCSYFALFVCVFFASETMYSLRRLREESGSGFICSPNFLNCSKSSVKNIGLLLTKDDGKILKTWFEKNSRYFYALVVLDGSQLDNFTYSFFSSCKSVFYFHEGSFPNLKAFSDGELRELGHKLVTDIFGYNIWITMAHADEFFFHSPLKIIDQAEKEKADFVKWRALHVLPHPSEYNYYLEHKDVPVTDLFRHYYHFGPGSKKGSFLESRMFRSRADLYWNHKQGTILPVGLNKELSLHPAYLHYKVHDLSTAAYTVEGIHKHHWSRVSSEGYDDPRTKRGVGIRWRVQSLRDFFVDHFPNSKKYDHVSRFDGKNIESYLDIGDKFKGDAECTFSYAKLHHR